MDGNKASFSEGEIMKEQKNRMVNDRDFHQSPNYTAPDKEKERLIKKLGEMITDRYAVKLTHSLQTDDPEYWALDAVLTKEEARFMLSFGKTRVPYSVEELAQKNSMSAEEAQKIIDHLVWIGVIEMNRENPDHHRQYNVPIFVPGSAEFMMMQEPLTREHPEIATFFNLMTQMPLEGMTPMIPMGGAGVGMHVIPIEKAIETQNQSVSVEHISHWLNKYDKYSVGLCTCRRQQEIRGEGSGDPAGEFCIGVGDMAEFCVVRGTGRYITYEEVLEILERAERHGYVHQITNIDGEDKIVAICNCAPGVCNALRTSQLYNTPNLSRSAYRAHVEREKCVACGKCVEVCPVGAAKLGQKLCRKDGTEVTYPKTLLPDAVKWTEDNWNPNYREDAKINCYDSGTAPCKTACPAHLAVQGYVKMAGEGRYLDALKLIKKDNPFPAVCGSICNRRCEDACTRGTVDSPIAIDEIKKFIAAKELEQETRYIPVCENPEGKLWGAEYRMAVIGAGPAGLTCAYYLRERGYDVTVFEKEEQPGGMLIYGIPNFQLEKDVLRAEIDVLRQMGVEFRCGTEVGKDITIEELRRQGYKAFYAAIGLQGGRRTGVPGEDAEGVKSGVAFLKEAAAGFAEGTESELMKLSGDVVVIGGGNVAVDVARTAVRCTDGKVTMLCLESAEEMPAAEDEAEDAAAEGVIIRNGWGPKEILTKEITAADGTSEKVVTGVVFKRCTQVKDAEGRFCPQYDENDTMTIPCSSVLEAVGQSAEWGTLLEGTKVELGRGGLAEHDAVTFQTAEPDIFVGGDAGHGARFAIDAIADGKKACESMHRYVHAGQSLTIGRDLREFRELDKDDIQIPSYDHSSRQVPGHKAGDPKGTFHDLREPFTQEQVRTEAGRCLGCGATTVDENRCIGCGLCTTRCEFDAIHLERDLPEASNMVATEDKLPVVGKYALKRQFKILFNKGENVQ
jgi:NADPH-dependent glutamate synthase beta subunit-like oxidoreductase/Fe-S-cluster-containing hydrogenase component 2